MFCKKCGSKIEEGKNFCVNCGTKVNIINTDKIPKIPKVKLNKKLIYIISAIAIAIVVLIIIVTNVSSYIRVNAIDLYSVEFNGLNGDGVAILTIDEAEQERITNELIEKSDGNEDVVYSIYDLEFEIAPNEKLSNDDEVTITAKYNKKRFDEFKIIIDNPTQKIKVEGLAIPKEIDVFEGLTIEYSGMSPFIEYNFITGNCSDFTKENVQFSVEKQYLSNGETFKVIANYNSAIATEMLYRVVQDEKEFTVDKALPALLSTTDGVDLSLLKQAMYDKLHLEENSSGEDFIGENLGLADGFIFSYGYTLLYNGIVNETEKGEAFLLKNNEIQHDDYEIYVNNNAYEDNTFNKYVIFFQCEVGTKTRGNSKQDQPSEEYENKLFDVIVVANDLYTDAEGILRWDDGFFIQAKESEVGDLMSTYVTKQQEEYNVISMNNTSKEVPSTKNETPNASSNSNSDFKFENSSTVGLTDNDLTTFIASSANPKQDLALARNEIFARYGNIFDDAFYRDYFSKFDWYTPTHKVDFDTELNDIERQNINLIKEYESKY